MAEKLQFELVSPEKLLLSEAVEMVVVPGGEGNFGVLPGHALLISTVRPGVIDVYENNAVTERMFVSGGFAEVTPERCTVLADEVVPLSSLDRADIEQQVKVLESTAASLKDQMARLQGAERDRAVVELRATERRLTIANAKLTALETAAH
jgi:F-type H+-transporting ATPase subunit epsilon